MTPAIDLYSPIDITPESVCLACRDVLVAPVSSDLVLLDTRNGIYFGLNESGARVWELLQQPSTVAAVYGTLLQDFDVAPDNLWSDLSSLLREMIANQLVDCRAVNSGPEEQE
jgi:hypothetical protein